MTEVEEGPVRRAVDHRCDGLVPAAERRDVAAHHRRGARRRTASIADARSPRPGHARRRRGAPGCVRRRDGRVAARRHHVRRSDERDQGRRQHGQPATGVGVAARRVAVRQRRLATHVRRDAVGDQRRAPPLPRLDAMQGTPPRPRRAAAVVGHDGPAARRTRLDQLGRGHRPGARRVRVVQPQPGRSGRPRRRRALDRRRTARRQAGRRVLHVVRRRPLARAAELERLGRLGADDGARAGPRVPQRAAGASHAAAATAADGAGRDRQHLLRDPGGRGRAHTTSPAPTGWPCSTSTCRGRRRWSSTSDRGCCSRPRSSPAASGARSACRSSTR